MREQKGLEVSRDTKFREGPTGQALSRAAEKKKLKNAGSHQQEALNINDIPIPARTTVTVRDDKTGRFSGYRLSTTLSSGKISHNIPPTFQEGSKEAEHHVVKAVSHVVQTDN